MIITESFLGELVSYYQRPASRSKENQKIGTLECWNIGMMAETQNSITPLFHHSILPNPTIPTFHYSIVFFGGRNMRLNPAEVISATPKIANDSP